MKAGTLRHRVTFQRAADTQDQDTGATVTTWPEDIGTVWARVEPLRGREALVDGGIRDEMDTRIVARYSPQIAAVVPKDRALFADRIYNIVSVAHIDMAKREVQFLCKSGVNDG